MRISFKESFIAAAQDQLIDRREWAELKHLGQQAIKEKAPDAYIAKHALPYLDQFQQKTRIQYGIPGQAITFDFTPAYSELDGVPGATAREQVQYLSQSDNLPQTKSDAHRCGTGALVNSWLLLGGSFESLAQKLNLSPDQQSLNYQNVHLAQDALYTHANTNGQDGLTTSYQYSYRGDRIVTPQFQGEIKAAIDLLGLEAKVLVGDHVSQVYQRRDKVERFWQEQPNGILLTGVHMNTQTGELSPPGSTAEINHFVAIYQHEGVYTLVDTGASDNGLGNSSQTLSAEQLEQFVHQAATHVIALHR